MTPHRPQTVVFLHGKESGPNGLKIQHLTEVAHNLGFETIAPDMQGILDPVVRLSKLRELGVLRPTTILVGSSLGGLVACMVDQEQELAGMLLLAPAVAAWGGSIRTAECCVVHGFQDEVVPATASVELVERSPGVSLILLQDSHRLEGNLSSLGSIFKQFLGRFDQPNI